MNLSKNVLLVLFCLLLSCKDNKSKNTSKDTLEKITKEIKKNENLNDKKIDPPFNNNERELNESAVNFMNRIYNNSIVLNHPIIETDNWIKDTNVIFVFINKELEGDLGTNVEGYIYISTNKKTYQNLLLILMNLLVEEP